MANIFGRQVVVALTNKSGGGVIAGDVVVVDTTNNDAFTTSTAGAFTGGIGVAQETIASNATGRVLTAGYAALVNVNASVTRGNFGKTHTVAKQATSAGSSRVAGAFCQFLTGGTTPDALLFGLADASTGGSGTPGTPAVTLSTTNSTGAAVTLLATDATIAVFDATTPSTQALGDAGTVGVAAVAARRDHKHVMPAASSVAGYQFDYVQSTSGVSITATTEATANTIVTANAVTYDGSTDIYVEFFAPYAVTPSVGPGHTLDVWLYDGTSIGKIYRIMNQVNGVGGLFGCFGVRKLTPSAGAHTYSIRGSVSSGTGSIAADTGGATKDMPLFIRQRRA